MTEDNQSNEIKELLEKNLRLTEEIHGMTKSIKSYVTFQKIMSLVYFLIIVVPIVLGIIYLPPLLNNFLGQYQELLGMPKSQNILDQLLKTGTGNVNINDIKSQLNK